MGIGVLQQYRDLLPVNEETPMFTMGEGDTPLVRSRRLGPELGCADLFFKLEGCNPTGSFKDRGMVVAIAKALEDNSVGVMCASTGNTSASAAAYAAYCNLVAWVLIPKGEVALGKLAQAMAYGARILLVDGNFDAALALVREFTESNPITLVNSVNPHRIEGQKTAAFEVSDVLGDAPDYLFIPVGNAGNITAYWRGFVEYHQLGRNDTLPRMMGFQAEGAAPIVLGKPVPFPQTIASAIRIGNPASWKSAERARDQSGGVIDAVSDDEILEAYRLLSSREGIFGEPASAASVAGLLKMQRNGLDLDGKRVVCVITGSGLKDPDMAVSSAQANTVEVQPNLEAIETAIMESLPSR
jgi:threonine synthase